MCMRCFRRKDTVEIYSDVRVCKACKYEIDAVVGFLEYHGYVAAPLELVQRLADQPPQTPPSDPSESSVSNAKTGQSPKLASTQSKRQDP